MRPQDQAYINQVNAWIVTQQNSIDSCDVIIKHCLEQIKMHEARIVLEAEEKKAKIKTLQLVKDDLEKQSKEFLENQT